MSRPITASPVSRKHLADIPPIGISQRREDDRSGSWEVDVRDCQVYMDKVKLVYKVSLYKLRIAQCFLNFRKLFFSSSHSHLVF